MEDKVRAMLQPIADEMGVEILRISLGGKQTPLLQVIVDRRGGVDSDMLERLSRGLSLQLDVEDLIAGKFRLEVSSPGYDWPLTTQADFDRYAGDWLRVLLHDGQALEGENLGLNKDRVITIRNDKGQEQQIPFADTAKVVRGVNWKALSRKKK